MRLLGVASLGALLLGTACRWAGLPARETVFAAHEAGLTLVYENPQLSPEARFGQRLQVRVAASKEVDGGRTVRVTFTSMRGEVSALYFQKDGGIWLSQDGKTAGLQVYPAGFPDRVTQWEVQGTKFRMLGRAVADLHGLKLPDTADRVGVWVEAESPQGLRQRTFLLPDMGEVETLAWRDGKWVSINRLVSRGFTDAPVSPE
jgi:hypothetical protein